MELFKHALLITGFVAAMMIIVEYVNVLSLGRLKHGLGQSRWTQYFLAAVLGAIPGCLGSFTLVTMFTHRLVSIGAVVAGMIATSGDEAFVMLGLFPKVALALTAGLAFLGVAAGFFTDTVLARRSGSDAVFCKELVEHGQDERSVLPTRETWKEILNLRPARGILTFVIVLYMIGIASGEIDHSHAPHLPGMDMVEEHDDHAEHDDHDHAPAAHLEENVGDHESEHDHEGFSWVTITILLVCLITLLVLLTVPDHFIEDHLWNHVIKSHLPRLFIWTFGVILAVHFIGQWVDIRSLVQGNVWIVLLIACIVGLLPQSGPHLAFVTMYASGVVPIAILAASSIVQDGHGTLPLLAHSPKAFLKVKAANFVMGFLVGAALLFFG